MKNQLHSFANRPTYVYYIHIACLHHVTKHRSRCHGNVRLNGDSKSRRSLAREHDPVDVRGGQSARDDIIDVIKPAL